MSELNQHTEGELLALLEENSQELNLDVKDENFVLLNETERNGQEEIPYFKSEDKNINPKRSNKIGRSGNYRYLGDVNPAHFTSVEVAKRSWEIVKRTMAKKKRQIIMLQKANRKSKKRVETLNLLIRRLKDNKEMKETILKMSTDRMELESEPPALTLIKPPTPKPPSPLTVLKSEPESVKESVKDIGKQDILVCGNCHSVFYFVEEFQEHKLSPENCKESSNLRETLKEEKKPQIWAFTLWKNTKCTETTKEEKAPTSWTIYQSWRNLNAHIKDAWLTAGENIQALNEIVSKIPIIKYPNVKIKTEVMDDENIQSDESNQVLKQVQWNNKMALLKKQKNTRKAARTGEDPQTEYLVEKITSKRYNPRKKTFEYFIKWEGFDSSKNTWEPAANLQNCRGLLEEYEKLLLKQKEKMKLDKSLAKENEKIKNIINSKDGSRPQRTSKQKALNQVKQWVGTMESDENTGKHVFSEDSEDDEAYERRMNEDYSSDSENDSSNMVTIKRLSKAHNGLDRKKIDLPDNILIPDAKGIVRINQKQLPALSSGVYVMSKTAGIIKLDTQTSKLATSGGQTVLKVAPKIGQTSIKVIKNGTTTTTKAASVLKQKPQIIRNYGKMFMQKKNAETKKITPPEPLKDARWDDEESDGIEELEFPTDIPLPTASDSPPPEFSLCPLTGRVVDKDGQPLDPDPEPQPEPEPESEKDDSSQIDNTAALDNLVNMAAADILEDLEPTAKRIKVENKESEEEDISISPTEIISAEPNEESMEERLPELSDLKTKTSSNSLSSELPKTTDSILSTALTNANIGVRRKSTSGPTIVNRNQGVKHILNRTLPQPRPTPTAIITRVSGASGIHRTRVEAPRPREQVVRKRFIHSSGTSPAGSRPTFKKTMDTKVYTPKHSQQQVNTFVATPTRTPTVISMPSLIDSEPPPLVLSSGKPMIEKDSPTEESEPTTVASTQGDVNLNSLALGDSETPLLITGEDGTIYQVAGQNEDGQTILITQNDDGEQQCLLVAPENAGIISQALMKSGEPTVSVAHDVDDSQDKEQVASQEPVISATAVEGASSEAPVVEVDDAADDSQVVAQIISANPPSPGGTRKVVLMLPDGNFMMTEVTAEQYAALELDK